MSAASNTPSDNSGARARIDSAHPPRGEAAPAALERERSRERAVTSAVAAGASASPIPLQGTGETAPQPVALHAAELAERLQHRQVEIDRRTAMLAAQEAEIENKLRNARLWFDEREQELDERANSLETNPQPSSTQASGSDGTESLESRQRELDARQADLYQQIEAMTEQRAELEKRTVEVTTLEQALRGLEESVESRRQLAAEERIELSQQCSEFSKRRIEAQQRDADLEQRDADLQSRESQLAYRKQEIDAAVARFEKLGVTQERMQALDEQASEFAARSRYLDQAEELLGEENQKLAARRQKVDDRLRESQEQILNNRRTWATEQEEARTAAAWQAKQIEQREAELDGREESLQNLRQELEMNQREVLEMRLATEETWAQLTGALSPASLTRSISQTRSRLADHYEYQITQLAERREELEQFRGELASEHTDIEHRRTQFQDWLRRREQEIEQQAARLIAREQELDRQQMHYEAQESRWKLERDDYRAEIRQLLSQLRTDILNAAA